MGDPDLRSDETVLVRTQEVYVKSIPFEGILTNKRIVLVDRAKNLLPPKEIPLATIKDVEGGENAVSDPVVTVTVITRTGETRQMVLTFSRTSVGNRLRERDEWVKTLKENVSSSFEHVIRKVIPGFDQPQRRPEPAASPRTEMTDAPVPTAVVRSFPKKETDTVHPIKKIIENVPSKTPAAAKESDAPAPGYGTFCTRCGKKVPEGSGFCNSCGAPLLSPGSNAVTSRVPDSPAQTPLPINGKDQTPESSAESPSVRVPAESPAQHNAQRPYSPLYDNPPEPAVPPQPIPEATALYQKPVAKPLPPRLFSPNELSPTPLNPASMPTAASPPPQKPHGAGRMPGKKVFMAIGVIILLIAIAVAGIVFVYPMISGSGSLIPGSVTVVPTTSLTPVVSSTPQPTGTSAGPRITVAPTVPATGVYAHISYIGSWKGTYGLPSVLQSVTNSGDRFLEIENATGPVEVTIEKMDSSTRHELVVEIFKNGVVLTRGNTSAGFGKVTVSADATTGVAQPPRIGTGNLTPTALPTSTAIGNVTVTTKPLTPVITVKTTSSPVTNGTTVKTTVPVTNTTTSSP